MIVEDGTGLTDSDSYVSVVFADDYFSARGVYEWSLLEETAKEQALVRATDYVDSTFKWYGKKQTAEQALRFPRVNISDYEGNEITGIPTALKQAVCEAAVLTSAGTQLFQTENENGAVTSEKIGELSFTYDRNGSAKEKGGSPYDSVNAKLRGLYIDTSRKSIVTGRIERV